jgi:hypothetical protein
MNIKHLIPLLVVVLVAAGCNKADQNKENQAGQTQGQAGNQTAENGAGHAHEPGHGATLAGSRINLQNRNSLKPGEVTLAFKIYGLDAHEFGPNDLNSDHDKLVHLILLRDDATGFQHLHPDYANSRWSIKTNVPEQGQYSVYVDISPKEETPQILRVPVTIGGPTQTSKLPVLTPEKTVTQDGITVSLNKQSFKTKEHGTFSFTITRNGEPITNIDPYLGAFGHVVVVRHGDPDDYFHAHPITATKPLNGIVEFESEFPAQGTYTMYAQFSISGQVRAFPITLSVTEEGIAPTHEDAANHDEGH